MINHHSNHEKPAGTQLRDKPKPLWLQQDDCLECTHSPSYSTEKNTSSESNWTWTCLLTARKKLILSIDIFLLTVVPLNLTSDLWCLRCGYCHQSQENTKCGIILISKLLVFQWSQYSIIDARFLRNLQKFLSSSPFFFPCIPVLPIFHQSDIGRMRN